MEVKLIDITQEAEKKILYCARVSSPNQSSTDTKLLNYCMEHGHWSVFEQANMTVEIQTSRAISAQLIRHRSFCFQEFSQRYAKTQGFEIYKARRQDEKNRQNSIDDMSEEDVAWFFSAQVQLQNMAKALYEEALKKGIAKEQARFLLPMSSTTKLYMTGNIRSWIHYLSVRLGPETQLEHRRIAEEIAKILAQECPIISKALTDNH